MTIHYLFPRGTMTTHRLVFKTTIEKIEERFTRTWVSGTRENAVFDTHSQGWFMSLAGSREALYVGDARPAGFAVGDEVEVGIQRAERAKAA